MVRGVLWGFLAAVMLLAAVLLPAAARADAQDEAWATLFDRHSIESEEFKQVISDFSLHLTNKALDYIRQNDYPTIGSGEKILIEFADYRCGYCKRQFPILAEAVQRDEIQLIIVEFPILGELSEKAARTALIARQNGVFADFHRQLMKTPRWDEADLARIAQSFNLPHTPADLDADAISEQLEMNYYLATLLGVSSTPTLFLNNRRIVGMLSHDDFLSLLHRPPPGE